MPEVDNANPYTQEYLNNLSTITRSLLYKANIISMDKYAKEVKQLREATFLGPPVFSPAIIKKEIMQPELDMTGQKRFNFPWCTGYSPVRCHKGLYILIHKYPDNFHPNRLIHIFLFDIKSNSRNKKTDKNNNTNI